MMKSLVVFLLVCVLAVGSDFVDLACAAHVKQVSFYPAYGYRQGNGWVVPMRVWVRERRYVAEGLTARVAASMGKLGPGEIRIFRSRILDFLADDEFRESIVFQFDNDAEKQQYRVRNERGDFPKTDLNGLVEGVIEIPASRAEELLSRQGSRNGWLTFHATSAGHVGRGRIRLVDPAGLSVISDIDDTVKITEIPAGPKVVVRNTFFREFEAAPGMAQMYGEWKDASFHYVSGCPWQLYEPLAEFLFGEGAGFPEGTFHMRDLRKNLLSARTWKDLTKLVTAENVTYRQKVVQISEIMGRFPGRKFILVGDSGEKDPEVYRIIKDRFPGQVQEIRIRDVVNDAEKSAGRLEGMTIVGVR